MDVGVIGECEAFEPSNELCAALAKSSSEILDNPLCEAEAKWRLVRAVQGLAGTISDSLADTGMDSVAIANEYGFEEGFAKALRHRLPFGPKSCEEVLRTLLSELKEQAESKPFGPFSGRYVAEGGILRIARTGAVSAPLFANEGFVKARIV